MNTIFRWAMIVVSLVASAQAAQTFEDTMQQAAVEYRRRADQASTELNQTRARIADEKAPLLQQVRAAEDRLIAVESETTRMETQREESSETRRKLLQELDAVRKTTTYLTTLANDGLKAASDGLAPGESQHVGERLQALQKQLDNVSSGANGRAALDIVDFLLDRTEESVGGYRISGKAMLAETNQVVPGTFAFVGPETFFLPTEGNAAGTVRPRAGATHPASYRLEEWKPAAAQAFFAGQAGTMVADASSGKALRLTETKGTVWDHIKKGGAVAFAIIAVGLIAAVMIFHKLRDIQQLGVDSPETVEAFLDHVASGNLAQARVALPGLRLTTREMFGVGLRYYDQPKAILEERLQAVLLAQRLHYERRLPLLAVIATAAPLMGLLGTVVGMVKTFALITVFGTGNAGKLSSGISEVLVATELGLAVAIPTLVIHGFLAQRVHKNLALLERYALQFTTAVQAAQVPARETDGESVPA